MTKRNIPHTILVFQRISTTPQVVGRVIVDEPRPMGITLGRPSIESSSSIGTIKSKSQNRSQHNGED